MREQLTLFEATKKCTDCGKVKAFGEYWRETRLNVGYAARCKKCSSKNRKSSAIIGCKGNNSLYCKEERKALFNKGLKPCGTCKEIKPFDSFHTDNKKGNFFRLSSSCKECASKRQRGNKDENNKRGRQRRAENLDEVRAKERAAHKANPEKQNKRMRNWNKRQEHSYVVYFILYEGWIKIGYTHNLRGKLRSLRNCGARHPTFGNDGLKNLGSRDTQHQSVLEVIKGNMPREQFIHTLFPMIRYGTSEWFKATPELYDFISKVDIAS